MTAKTITTARITSCSISGAPLDHCRRPVSDYLGHRLAHLRGVKAHHHDRVGAHCPGVLDHAIDRVPASVLNQASVFDDLTAAQGPQPRHDVSTEPSAAHDDAEHLAER